MKNLLFFVMLTLAMALMLVDIATHNQVQAQTMPTVILTKPVPPKDIEFDTFTFYNSATKYAKLMASQGYDITITARQSDILVIAKKY